MCLGPPIFFVKLRLRHWEGLNERVVVGICNDNGKLGDAVVDEGDGLSFDRRCEPNDVGFF